VSELTARVTTEEVGVVGQQAPPGSLFPQDQQWDISQMGIQCAQQIGKLEVRKPARETLREGVSGRTLRKRYGSAAARRGHARARAIHSDLRAQRAGVWRIAQDRGVDSVE